MARLVGNMVGKEICEALNIDPTNVYKTELIAAVGGVAYVVITRYVTASELCQFGAKLIEKYEVKEK